MKEFCRITRSRVSQLDSSSFSTASLCAGVIWKCSICMWKPLGWGKSWHSLLLPVCWVKCWAEGGQEVLTGCVKELGMHCSDSVWLGVSQLPLMILDFTLWKQRSQLFRSFLYVILTVQMFIYKWIIHIFYTSALKSTGSAEASCAKHEAGSVFSSSVSL